MLGAQVSVALARHAVACSRVERRGPRDGELVSEALEVEDSVDLRALLDHAEQLVDVRPQSPLDCQRARAAHGHDRRRGMEPRKRVPHRDDVGTLQLAPCEPGCERAALVEAAHLDDVLDGARVVLSCQLVARTGRGDRADAEVDVGRQPPVHPHLLAAHRMTPLRRPVVQERQNDRLLQLVRTVVGQEHPRAMGLAHRRRPRLAGEEPRLRQNGAHVIGGPALHGTDATPCRYAHP